jgi:hypothetical protein
VFAKGKMLRVRDNIAIVTGGVPGLGEAPAHIPMGEPRHRSRPRLSRVSESKFVTGAELVIDGGYTAQ